MIDLKNLLDEEHYEKIKNARTAGIDIGSRATKGVLLYDGKLYESVVSSGVSTKQTANEVLEGLIRDADADRESIQFLVGTGYGRVAVGIDDIPNKGITEISCHAMGAHYLNPETETIFDIGGQDCKAIKVDKKSGQVIEFVMNDKCAAGTGRFLEKVAQMLDLELDELGAEAVQSDNPSDISAQCVVFAESEVISLKAQGVPRKDIAAGVHMATARRVKNLLKRIGLTGTIVFTGGVSNNPGMVKAVRQLVGRELGDLKIDATIVGALGAAIYAHYAVVDS